MGGQSAEREVSLKSGTAVLAALVRQGVDAHAFDPARRSLGDLAMAEFDRVFIALHGRGGEDGTIQGVLETLRVPYTGSGVQASAIAIDKLVTKRIWLQEGIPTPRYRALAGGDRAELNAAVDELGLPLITKPPHEGSTIGITKVAGYSDMASAYALAAKYDSVVLAEQFIAGRELTCAVLGEGRSAEALPLIEIRAPGANYDYHNKYFSDETQYLCPAPVDAELAARIRQLCVHAYNVLGARGWGRVDVMLSSRDEPFLLELNTSPGMTGHSLVPMAARAVGMSYEDLVLRILQDAALDDGGRA